MLPIISTMAQFSLMMLEPNSSGFHKLYQVNVKTFIQEMNCLVVSVYVAIYIFRMICNQFGELVISNFK